MKILSSVIVILLVFACNDKINIELPYSASKFVIYAELSPDQPVSVKLDRTYPPTGKFLFDDTYLKTVKAELFEDGAKVEELKKGDVTNIFYASPDFRPKEGKSYVIKVNGGGLPEAVSEPQNIPQNLSLTASFSDETVVSPLNPSIPARLLNVRFKREKSENPYYVAEIIGLYNGKETSSSVSLSKIPTEFGDPCGFVMSSRLIFLKGECYNKEENEIPFFIELIGGVQGPNSPGNQRINSLRVKISTVNDFYYDFYINYSSPDGIFKAFEPTRPTVTNIIGGYGAVLGKNESEVILKNF